MSRPQVDGPALYAMRLLRQGLIEKQRQSELVASQLDESENRLGAIICAHVYGEIAYLIGGMTGDLPDPIQEVVEVVEQVSAVTKMEPLTAVKDPMFGK